MESAIRCAGNGVGVRSTEGRSNNEGYNFLMRTKLRKIGNNCAGLPPRKVIEQPRAEDSSLPTPTETASDIEPSPFDGRFCEQVEAFRRTEPRHRSSYRKLAR